MSEQRIKVFSKLYVGLKAQGSSSDDRLPLGFAAPFENNAACKKRQATIETWASHAGYDYDPATKTSTPKQRLPTKIVDNPLREGFRIARHIRRTSSWNGGNVVWRIEDPYGFELEIPSENFAKVIDAVGIEAGGMIPGKCVWGRVGAQNILIPEKSDLYQQSFADAEKMNDLKNRVPLASLQCGNKVILTTGDEVIFIGRLWSVGEKKNYLPSSYSNRMDTESELVTKQVYAVKWSDRNYRLYRDLKVVRVEDTATAPLDDFIKDMNDPNNFVSFAGSTDISHQVIVENKPVNMGIVLRPGGQFTQADISDGKTQHGCHNTNHPPNCYATDHFMKNVLGRVRYRSSRKTAIAEDNKGLKFVLNENWPGRKIIDSVANGKVKTRYHDFRSRWYYLPKGSNWNADGHDININAGYELLMIEIDGQDYDFSGF